MNPKTTALSLVLVALAAGAPSRARTPIVFSDGDFPSTHWTFSKTLAGGGGDAQFEVTGGGNPGAMVRTTTMVAGNCSAIYGFMFDSTATYSPSVQGAIESIDYDEDAKMLFGHGSGQATGLALRQSGSTYVMTGAATSTIPTWHPIPVFGLKATDFVRVVGGSCPGYVDAASHPNFVNGLAIEFGFFRANSQIPGQGPYTIVAALDNWEVTIWPLSYVALGDSYSSGEGLYPYFPTSATLVNSCHRSPKAYGFQVRFPGPRLAEENFLACSGAKAINVLSEDAGEPPENGPLELPQLSRRYPPPYDGTVIVNVDTDMATMTVGGNDLGFAEILCRVPQF